MLMNDPTLPPLQGNLIKPLLHPQHEVIQEWRIWSRLASKLDTSTHARKPSLAPEIGDLLVLLPTVCSIMLFDGKGSWRCLFFASFQLVNFQARALDDRQTIKDQS
ncbi:hypothetical protein CEXT_243791 [Caerostris extrusa]|uniref:Uncharacterized protein n=1 Tax=Caerostris extrusa TaxID=172846 RepID=A0AAV4T1T0_CAEEX|nr:hypothetical protein CEXT_243791 [Caerostris extrusa]